MATSRLYDIITDCESQLLDELDLKSKESVVHLPIGVVQAGLSPEETMTYYINRGLGLTDESGHPIPMTPESAASKAESLTGWVESLLILFQQMYRGRDFADFYLAVCAFIRSVTGKSILVGFSQIWEKVTALFHEIVEEITNFVQGDEETFENPFTTFRNWIVKVDEVKSNPVVQKCRKMFLYILSFSFLEKFGITFDTFWFTKAEAEYHKEKHNDSWGFLYSLMDGTSYILERLFDCYKTGTWSALTHSSTSYGKWVDDVYAIKVDSIKLHNPEANGMSYHEFLNRLDTAIEQGRAICKFMISEDPKAKMTAKRLLSELEMIKANECTKKAARQSRDAPFALLYYAGSGIGKSTLEDLTFQHFGKVHGLPTDDEYHYSRTFSEDFYSGFTTSMWSIVLDDIASRNPNLGDDPSMNDVIQIINNVSFTPPQADLADKGKTPMKPALVQGTTNSKDLNAHAYYANPLAIQRRFPYVVTVTVKAEFAHLENGQVPEPMCRMLDSSKTPPLAEGEYPDYWEFEIEKVKANVTNMGKQFATHVPATLHKTSSIHEYLAYISKESIQHKRNQTIVRDSAKQYARATICDTCYRVTAQCVCSTVQSTEVMVGGALLALGSSLFYAGSDCFASRAKSGAKKLAIGIIADTAEEIARRLRVESISVAPQAASEEEEVFFDATEPEVETTSHLDAVRDRLRLGYLSVEERLQCEHDQIRGVMTTLGGVTQKSMWGNMPFLSLLLALPMVLGAFKMYSMYKAMNTQGSEESSVRAFCQDEKPNVWFRETYTPAAWELGCLTKSWKTLEPQQVEERVQRQTMFASVTYTKPSGETVARTMRILCLEGQLYVTNNHNLPAAEMDLTVTPTIVEAGVGQQYTVRLFEKDLHRVPESDLVFFVVGCVPPRSDLSGLVCDKSFRTKSPGRLISRGEDGLPQILSVSALQFSREDAGHLGEINCFRGTCEAMTVSGQCGSPYVGFTPVGPVLLGLHILGGKTKTVACTHLSREDVQLAKAKLGYRDVHAGKPNLTDAQGREIEIGPLHAKSTFRYIEQGTANVYGSFQGFRAASKSKVKKTMLHDSAIDAGYVVKVGAPVMNSFMPWRLAHLDIVQQKFVIEQSRLDACVQAFSHDIIMRLSPADKEEMKVLDDMATVNGLPGVKFIDKMNRNTSMGFPWKHSKRQELEELGLFDIWPDAVQFKPEFYERVEKIISLYKNKTTSMPVYVEHLKDEVISLAKVDAKKTRVFSGCPADFAFVVRKYLLSTVRVIQKNRYIFECAPGTNATSLEWDEIYHYLTQHGSDRIVAGDYSKFDKRMSAQMILAAFKVLYNMLEAAGWSDENLCVIWTMAFDVAFPVVDANGDLVQFWGSNPSGHPLTVVINSLVNSLYVRYAWSLTGNSLDSFKEQVALMTYGDDNIMGISRSVVNFDHTVLQTQLAKIGVVYTMADKEAESVPFLNIAETSFLKRAWVYNKDVGSHVAQLEHASIEKGLLYHIPSSVVCPEQQAVDVIGNAMREYFFYGREVYNARKSLFEAWIENLNLGEYSSPIPTYDACVEGYLTGNMDITEDGRCPQCSAL